MDAGGHSIRETTTSAQTTTTADHIADDAAMGLETSSDNSCGGGVPPDRINRDSSVHKE